MLRRLWRDPEVERTVKAMPKDPGQQPETPRHETPEERADRNLAELLQELRVVQTGVQILFSAVRRSVCAGAGAGHTRERRGRPGMTSTQRRTLLGEAEAHRATVD
jgi:Family of unknown function (DUF6328)